MKTVICLLALLCPVLSMCQRLSINGQVQNTQGQPINHATVTLLRTGQNTQTNSSGRFSFTNTYTTDSLRISAVGYITATVTNNQRGLLTIPLQQQVTEPSTPFLQVGDSLPHTVFYNVLNTAEANIHLPATHNKIQVLDFWATWCTNCVLSFPALDSLVQLMPDSLEVILVSSLRNADDTASVQKRLAWYSKRYSKQLAFPILLKDTVLNNLFAVESLPQYIWLLNGRVLAINNKPPFSREYIRELYHYAEPLP